jgi:hypothetical protein
MAIGQSKHAIGTFSSRQAAQQALYQLRESGLSLDKVSVITKDANRNRNADIKDRIGNKAGDVGTMGAIAGGTAGTMLGLVEGLVVLLIPGVDPTLAIGTVLANTLLAGGIGATGGALMGGLIGWGIPAQRARFYRDRLSQGYYLIIVEGTEYDLRRAEPIFAAQGLQDWSIYDAPQSSA